MSFNAKNLRYEQKEPEFLRKLKQQYAPQDAPRHNRPSTISKRLQVDGDDDGPTYVDADTNEVVTQADYQDMMGVSSKQAGKEGQKETDEHDEKQTEKLDSGQNQAADSKMSYKENVAEVGERKKRRVGKMIGDDEGVSSRNEVKIDVDQATSSSGTQATHKKSKKKIKLSFAD